MDQTRLRFFRFLRWPGKSCMPGEYSQVDSHGLAVSCFRQRRSPPPAWWYSATWNWVVVLSSLNPTPGAHVFLEQPCKTRGPNLGWCFTPCSVMTSQYLSIDEVTWSWQWLVRPYSRVRRLQTKKRNGEMEQTYRDVGLQAVNHTHAFEMTWRTIMTSIFRRSGSIADGNRIILLSMNEPNILETHVCHSRTGNHPPPFFPSDFPSVP